MSVQQRPRRVDHRGGVFVMWKNHLEITMANPKPSHKFPKGNKFGGRPKGSRDLLTSSFIEELAVDFAKHGEQAIQDCRNKDLGTYLRLIASVIPKEFTGEINHNYVALMPVISADEEQWQKQYGPEAKPTMQ